MSAKISIFQSLVFLFLFQIDLVLEDVRPFLISDGGNVDVVSVEDGVVSLKLQGACTSCPSSSTTMTMGIERVLKEKFGDALKDIRQVFDEEVKQITVEAVNAHLDILRPAIKNYGGSVEVLSVEGEDCVVKYVGPESTGMGIRAAIKEKCKGLGHPLPLSRPDLPLAALTSAKICAIVDFEKSLPAAVIIQDDEGNTARIRVEYGRLPPRCSSCTRFGHSAHRYFQMHCDIFSVSLSCRSCDL